MQTPQAKAPACEHYEVTRMETYDTQELVAVWVCVGCRRRFEPVSVAQESGGMQALDEALRPNGPR